MYYKHFHRFIDFKNPQTFNEKLNWLKLNDRRPEYTQMVDKYAVRDYISEKLGEEYLIPLLGVWDDPQEVDFDALPNQFVLKWNHDSGSVIICRDKSKLDIQKTVATLASKRSHNGYWYGREWPYKNVKPRIIAEEYMEDSSGAGLRDYKFYCFNGTPKFLYISEGLEDHSTARISFVTTEWEFASYERSDFKPFDKLPPKPECFDQMLELAAKLSMGVDFLRVDFYEIDEKVFFSELTFFPCGGFMPFKNMDHNIEIGEMLHLSEMENK